MTSARSTLLGVDLHSFLLDLFAIKLFCSFCVIDCDLVSIHAFPLLHLLSTVIIQHRFLAVRAVQAGILVAVAYTYYTDRCGH